MRRLTTNLWLKLISLAIAMLLWYATVGPQETTTGASVPIQLRNIPRDMEISSELPDSAYIEVRGSSRRLDELEKALVIIDLSGISRAGERTISILDGNVSLPAGVQFQRAVPSQIRLHFEPRLTREVPVVVRYATIPDGYQIQRQQVSPASVRIVGPESRVNAIDRVQTDPIELPPDDEELTFRLHAFAGDAQVRLEKPDQFFTVKVVLEKNR
ncbi:MAG: CdaR family protein [Bryobacteraceae bacterium]|nr:CdaR family protein [Bryobacteraceae bacterium]